MTRLRPLALALAAVVFGALVAGCPFQPQLDVQPKTLTFGTAAVTADFTIENTGGGTLTWTLEEVVRADEDSPWVAQDVAWLSAPVDAGQTQVAQRVRLTADRSGQVVGNYADVGVRILSNGGDAVIPVSMTIAASLSAAPSQLSLSAGATSAQFQIFNADAYSPASWVIRYLSDPDHPENATDLPANLMVSPDQGTTVSSTPATIEVSWTDIEDDFYLLIESDMGDVVVSLLFGEVLEGLDVSPATLRVFLNMAEDEESEGEDETPEQPESILNIANVSALTRSFTAEIQYRLDPLEDAPLAVSPSSGTVLPGKVEEVGVKATDPEDVLPGSGYYDLIIRSGDEFLIVPIIVENRPLPEIAISEEPQTESSRPEIIPLSVLDFGREDIQAEFWIANVGKRESKLYYKITHEDEGVLEPIIVDVSPSEGGVNGEDGEPNDFYHPVRTNELIDGRVISVTINRNNLEEEVEFRTITVQAYDNDPSIEPTAAPIEAVEEATLQVRVEQQPLTVEGALNLSRPPFVLRYTFLLRDRFSEVIPTRKEDDRERISFTITEDGEPVDLDETNLFIQGPEQLKVNLIVMLDFTGSMYYAGTETSVGVRKEPGEAIEDMKEAAKDFLDDIPAHYRVALMFHNDRQQDNRLLHSFTTNRDTLKAALDAFSLPAADHGVTDVRDALMEGIDRLVAEDPEQTLPFDGADVRAIVYITDGNDNASVTATSELETTAWDSRVRLFPVAYAPYENINAADLLTQAKESGGHFYNAGNVDNLAVMLANAGSLALEPSTITGEDRVYFNVVNVGESTIDWTIAGDGASWITSISPSSGAALPSSSTTVTVKINPDDPSLTADTLYLSTLTVTAGNESGTAAITLTPHDAAADEMTLTLRDEPGVIWNDLRNQIVVTYLTPKQASFTYSMRAQYLEPDGSTIMGFFDHDGIFYLGNVDAGQVTMLCSGIETPPNAADPDAATSAEVFVRTDYVPRNTTKFRMRFWVSPASGASDAAEAALEQAQLAVALAPDGLLSAIDQFDSSWRMVVQGDGNYYLLTSQDNYLPYGAFGNLLKITISNLGAFLDAYAGAIEEASFNLHLRMDNQIYVSPAAPGHPSETKFFQYPGGQTNPGRALLVGETADLASPAATLELLAWPPIEPEALDAWDSDLDGLPDFNDPVIDDPALPGTLTVPNPLDVSQGEATAQFRVRNNRLDMFTWAVDPASLPAWVGGVTYGPDPADPSPAPSFTLEPDFVTPVEYVNLHFDYTGLEPGTRYDATLVIETDYFGSEELPVSIVAPSE